jgi:asparagine synthase (glutamine-hydrolysing)
MSGIVGILRPDGAAVDQALARRLTRFLSFRGPDAQEVWCSGPVALGHAMLRATEESACERQPAGLDGRYRITADARIDARTELSAALKQSGRNPMRNAPDCELILHAYATWGEDCLQRLRGDFVFAIWDAHQRTLFCARDHLGIKPFYFVEHKDFFLFSNTLDCVRMHPEVSGDLNEAAIADFLLFGLNCDPAATTFRAIRRLPPAHFLCVSADGLRIGRYWSMPVDGRIRYHRADEYTENFQVLLREAVSDRLRGSRVGIMLSGGLDSSSLAATARELSPQKGEPGKLRAYTITYEKTLKEDDGAHAREVARFFDIPIRCIPMDGLRPFERWNDPAVHWPEPVGDPTAAGLFDQFDTMAAECRVAFNGEGPDNLLFFQMLPYAGNLLRHREYRRFCVDVARFLRVRRFPWRGIRQRVKTAVGMDPDYPGFPSWLNPDFVKRTDAKARWREGNSPRVTPPHRTKPMAHASMHLPQWVNMFEMYNPGVTRSPVEVRYPFLDLRIMEYMLAIPSFPWAFQKTLLRAAMTGRLPEKIRRRPKTPLPSEPAGVALHQAGGFSGETENWCTETEQFVRRINYVSPKPGQPRALTEINLRPLCLNYWLRHSRAIRYKLMAEVGNG